MAPACTLVFKVAVFHPAFDGCLGDLEVQLDIYQGPGTPVIKCYARAPSLIMRHKL